MSKRRFSFTTVVAGLFLGLLLAADSRADVTHVSVRIDPGEVFSARVRILFGSDQPHPDRLIWFLEEYGPVRGLTERLSTVGLIDRGGFKLAARAIRPGGRIDTANLGGVEYRMQLKAPDSSFPAAHISWAAPDGGLLMLDDLLPQGLGKVAVVRLDLPTGWRAFGPETIGDGFDIQASNIEKTAIRIGPGIRETRIKSGRGEIRIGTVGEWLFSDTEVERMAASLVAEYEKVIGNRRDPELTISISRFPFPASVGNWEGDTRGRCVTIFSSDMPFKNQSLQRLHEQLRHELFHLWIPNGVELIGRYDWFYEGFALYQSLKTGVELNQLRFEDFLDTLARAYDIDRAGTPRTSLVDATRERWNGLGTQVYARGMLVAFLCDLVLLDRSKGKVSVTSLVRDVFAAHRVGAAPTAEGNTAVLAAIRKYPELRPIVDSYITGPRMIEWTAILRSGGVIVSSNGAATVLSVDPKASDKARKTLEKLGINNWRRSPGR